MLVYPYRYAIIHALLLYVPFRETNLNSIAIRLCIPETKLYSYKVTFQRPWKAGRKKVIPLHYGVVIMKDQYCA